MKPRVLVVGSASVTGLNVVRSLCRSFDDRSLDMIGCDIASLNPANDHCENVVVPRAHDNEYVQTMSDLVRQREVTHVIVCDDHDLRALFENRTQVFPQRVKVNGFSTNTHAFLDKVMTTDVFNNMDIVTPQRVDTINEVHNNPIMIRNRYSGVGPKFKLILNTYDEWLASNYMHTHCNSNSQGDHWTRYIKGQEYTVDVLCDDDSKPIATVPRIRHDVRGGMVHHSETSCDLDIIERTRDLATRCHLVGMNCVQCIRDCDGVVHFIEVNSRPGSGLDLTVTAGVNMPLLWVLGAKETKGPTWGMHMLRCHTGYYFVA